MHCIELSNRSSFVAFDTTASHSTLSNRLLVVFSLANSSLTKRNSRLAAGLIQSDGKGSYIIRVTGIWNKDYFKALARIHEEAEKNGLRVAECAPRWMIHHS